MWKLKTISIFTIILGLVSLGWIVYDYLALTDISYNLAPDLFKRRMISYGVIPILLFHFSFFATMYFLFDFLKHQKTIIKEHRQFKSGLEAQKAVQDANDKEIKKEIKISEGNRPGI